MNRIKEGFVLVRNPFNARQISRISLDPAVVDCIVFWTKDPSRMLDKLIVLDQKKYNYLFQFTLTPYGKEIEPNLPEKNDVAATFVKLSERIGKERVLWRYDPILMTDTIDKDFHCRSFERIAKALAGHTDTCIISFLDFYAKCRKRLNSLNAREMYREDVRVMAEIFAPIAKAYDLKLETCAEEIDLSDLGIDHGKCIDAGRISKIIGRPLAVKKDRSQRERCGCIASVDIGAYNTCPHNCLYCYASHGSDAVSAKMSLHDKESPFLSGTEKFLP